MADTLVLYRDDADATGLDLSSYVDIAAGGINPGDEETREPVLSAGSLGYGQQLVTATLKARPFTAALLISATSADTLAALWQSIEAYLAGSRPQIEWRRQGASSSTWFRVRYGRLLGSARYDQRLESQAWAAKRVMALLVEPHGAGARMAFPAPVWAGPTGPGWASAGQGGLTMVGIAPSNPAIGRLPSIGGDAPVRWRVGIAATGASAAGAGYLATGFFAGRVIAGLTATPYSAIGLNAASGQASSAWRLAAVSTAAGPTSYVTDPWSPGGGFALQFMGTRTGSGVAIDTSAGLSGAWAPSAPPPGLYRVFAAIRARQNTSGGSAVPARAQLSSQGIRGPVATLALRSPSQWAWYDMGDVADLTSLSIGFGFPTGFTAAASPAFNLAALAAIPKMERYWEINNPYGVAAANHLAVSADGDNGITPVGIEGELSSWSLHRIDNLTRRSSLRGDLPITPPAASGATSAWYIVALAIRDSESLGAAATQSHHSLENVVIGLAAWDRYTFAK